MCQAIPYRVLEMKGNEAVVEFLGKKRTVSAEFVKPRKGDYVICSTGIITDVIPRKRAMEMLEACNADKKQRHLP